MNKVQQEKIATCEECSGRRRQNKILPLLPKYCQILQRVKVQHEIKKFIRKSERRKKVHHEKITKQKV